MEMEAALTERYPDRVVLVVPAVPDDPPQEDPNHEPARARVRGAEAPDEGDTRFPNREELPEARLRHALASEPTVADRADERVRA